jgi:hypothetical protein
VVQALGGIAVLIGIYFAWANLKTTQIGRAETLRLTNEGQITDRFTKAIDQLGSPKLELRLGEIYALERIARDSEKNHWPIMEVLTTFVRVHAPIAKTSDRVAQGRVAQVRAEQVRAEQARLDQVREAQTRITQIQPVLSI